MCVGVVNYLVGMEILTIMIENLDMLGGHCYDSSSGMTNCALTVAIDWEQ